MENQKIAYSYAIFTTLIWATVASAFKLSLNYFNPLNLLFYASFISLIILFLILVFQNKLRLLANLSLTDFLSSAFLGFLNPFLFYVLLFQAYSLLPAQEAQPLNYTWPILLVLLSIPLLRQKIRFKSILALIISFAGVLVISTRGDILGLRFASPAGVLFALLSALAFAAFWIYNLKDKREEVNKLFLNFVFGFFYTLIANILFLNKVLYSSLGFLGAVYIGLFEMGITFVLWSKSLKYSKTTAKVSNFIYLVPFLSLFIIHFALGEQISISTIVGLVLIVIGIIIQQSGFNRSTSQEKL